MFTVLRRAVLLACLAVACSRAPRSDLLLIEEVGPSRLDDGTFLRVRGEGFPVGREGTLRLQGLHHRAGAAPVPLDARLRVHVTSPDLAELVLGDEELDALGGRGTFVGHAELAFDAAGVAEGSVVGGRDVVLDVGGPGDSGADEVADFLERLGLALDEELPLDGGLVVRAVREGSLAAREGLAVGDRLLALGSLRLYAPGDLRPPPEASTLTVHVARPGLEGTREVLLDRRAPTSDPTLSWLLAGVVALVVLFGPGGRLLRSLRRPEGVPVVLGVAAASAALASFLPTDTALFAGFVTLPRLVDGWLRRRVLSELVATVVLGVALAVGMLVRVEGSSATLVEGTSASVVLRHPLALAVVLAAGLVLSRPTGARALQVLAVGGGAAWLGLLFFGSPWLGLPLALLFVALPEVAPVRALALALAAGLGVAALSFAVDLSAPVPLRPEEPRIALWLGVVVAVLVVGAWRRTGERRAHVFL